MIGPFSLGKYGLPINLFAMLYGTFICIFLPFPPNLPVTGSNMNYASPVFAFVLLFALAGWFLGGRDRFAGPIREVSSDGQLQSGVGVSNTSGSKGLQNKFE